MGNDVLAKDKIQGVITAKERHDRHLVTITHKQEVIYGESIMTIIFNLE